MNIVLTGFMGTGKSSVGKIIAERLSWQFFDMDEIIEKETGCLIAEIFKNKGEPYFRNLETKTVKLLSLIGKAVISTGGGVVLRSENMDAFEKQGVIVCLTASPETIFKRTKDNADRPLLMVTGPIFKIKELLSAREEYYKRCSFSVQTDNKTISETAGLVLQNPLVKTKL